MPVLIAVRTRTVRVNVRALRRAAEHMLGALGRAHAELSVSLVGDRTMRALNHEWRGKDKPTDVLSFGFDDEPDAWPADADGPAPPPMLGEVVIAPAVAARQAAERGVPPDEEMARLLAHGLLHLLGEDHETTADARRMFGRQTALLRGLRKAGLLPPTGA